MAEESFDDLVEHLEDVELRAIHGRITEAVGTLFRAVIPDIKIGEVCMIKRVAPLEHLLSVVVGFTKDEVLLSPLGSMAGVGPDSEVVPMKIPLSVKVGDKVLGRVLDGAGNPLDKDTKGELEYTDLFPVVANPPDPLQRKLIDTPIQTGIRCIDGALTCGIGQRIGIFAAAGGGKSSLLGMIAKRAKADVNVITLIGERGREVREFIEHTLGEEGMKRSVIVVSTSDQASQLRMNAAYVGTAIAEYFRSKGKNVILMMDSVTRYARALREIGLAAGEPPARAGFPPSVFANLPKLLERSGNAQVGAITGFYTVLVSGDDMNEPIADETRSILDGHLILSRDLAARGHYPAIDVLESASRIINSIIDKKHLTAIGTLREVLSDYKKNELLVRIGEYKKGSDKKADFAIDHIDKVNAFLKQKPDEIVSFDQTVNSLYSIFPS